MPIDPDEVAAAIDRIYDLLARTQNEYLTREAELFGAKFVLARAIDAAYDSGGVLGKNEREREANLRRDLAAEYSEVDRLERELRLAQRALRDAEVAAECLRLKIALIATRYPLRL